MASLNKVLLIGNCTRDPELRYTPKGTATVDLGLAVNRSYTADNGERREETTFVDVTLWGRTAEVAGEYLRKGRPVFIEGRLQLDSWEDKQTGQKRSKLKVVADNLQLLGGREDNGSNETNGNGGWKQRAGQQFQEQNRNLSQAKASSARPVSRPKPPVDADLDVTGDDIPF